MGTSTPRQATNGHPLSATGRIAPNWRPTNAAQRTAAQMSRKLLISLACPEGIEPPTHSLEGCCSIQLSYGQSCAWTSAEV